MYKKTDKKLWSGRTDTQDGIHGYRWHQVINVIDLKTEPLPPLTKNQRGFVILGFCCDEGVRRNNGRTGAREGPAAIRHACASLAWHNPANQVSLIDGGDIVCSGQNLEQAQKLLQTYVSKILHTGYLPLVFGGGHEVAFGSFWGIQKYYANKSVGIINFDAHFDLRTYALRGHSGSPFLQIADICSANDHNFSYMVLGIQKKNNTQILYQKAKELSVTFYEAEELRKTPAAAIKKTLINFIGKQNYIYLTLCMDVFDQAFAPAVSAPSAGGITPSTILPLIRTIASSGKLALFDIAEINPRYDRDGQTARLAAHLVFSIIDTLSTER
jgi:formiminoglutamase